MITYARLPKFCTYPEFDEVHKIMQNDVQKKDYTLELHSEMKTIYENLDTFDFKKWRQEKMNYFNDTLCGYFNLIIIKEYIISLFQ